MYDLKWFAVGLETGVASIDTRSFAEKEMDPVHEPSTSVFEIVKVASVTTPFILSEITQDFPIPGATSSFTLKLVSVPAIGMIWEFLASVSQLWFEPKGIKYVVAPLFIELSRASQTDLSAISL